MVSEVVDILDMWSFLETGYEELSKSDRSRVRTECAPFGDRVRFSGFDGNNEAVYIGIARFLMEQLDRFTKFKGRDLDTHAPTVNAYRRMLSVFRELRSDMAGRELTADEIISILKAMRG